MHKHIQIIHTLEQMLRAFNQANTTSHSLLLASPSAGIGFAGAGYYKAMLEYAISLYPNVNVTFILDCVDRPGWVMNALRQGFQYVQFKGNQEVIKKLKNLAQSYGAELITSPIR